MTACYFIIFLMVLCAAMEAVGIGLVYPLIRIIGNPNFLAEHAALASAVERFGVTNHRRMIFFASLCMLAFYVFKNFALLRQARLQISFSMNSQKDFTSRLYAYYMSKPYLYHIDTNIAIMHRNINAGGTAVFCNILVSALSIITEFITVIVIWSFLAVLDWVSALGAAFLLAPFAFLVLNHFRKKIGEYGAVQSKNTAEMAKWVNQGFCSLKETKVMRREAYFTKEFCKAYSKFTDSTKEYQFIQRIPRAIIELAAIGGILLLIAAKMLLKSDPDSLMAGLGVLALAAVRIMPSLNRIVSLFNDIKFYSPLFDEIYDDLLAVKKSKERSANGLSAAGEERLPFEKEISVENLSFAYPSAPQKDVLKDASFKIPKGAFCGIVGASGAGKTTFVDILLGLLPPKSGAILVDGQDICKNAGGWLNNLAYVPQSIYLIDGTIRENIAFGRPEKEVDEEKMERALKMSELYDFVKSLPDGLETSVGDRGGKLSGGQKQRIGIARALYNEPAVLVLDEATSALDNETERQITQTILKLKGKITIISIAHRLSALEDCDFKVEFKDGRALVKPL